MDAPAVESVDGPYSSNGMVDAGMRMAGHFAEMDLQKATDNSGMGGIDAMGEMMPGMNPENLKVDYQHIANVENGRYYNCSPAPQIEIKLFCGRVPKTLNDEDIKQVFEEFGVVKEVIIIRDKQSNAHKYSAFVRMASIAHADAAIDALNGKRTLDHSLGPLQVKYANGEAERLMLNDSTASESGVHKAKVFVGSLPKNVTEDQIRELFAPFGVIDEVFIMTDKATGAGRGCAFVKFAFKEQAMHTIKNLDGKKTLEGCSRPVEVRFAESKNQRQPHNQFQGGPVQNQVSSPYPAMMGPPMTMMHHHSNVAHSNQQPRSSGGWKEYWTSDMRPYYFNEQTQITQWERPQEFDSLVTPMGSMGSMGGMGNMGANMTSGDATGPKGANIFIFYVPNEWTQQDLISAFGSYGNILSARIATDKSTGRNKGYAFVSYDSPSAAAHAVHNMNGFLALSKRLKVSIKKGEESYVQTILDHLAAGGGAGSGAGKSMAGGMMGNVAGGYSMGGMPANAATQYSYIGQQRQIVPSWSNNELKF